MYTEPKKDRIRDIEKEIYSLKNHKSNSEKEQNELNRLKVCVRRVTK